MIKKLVLFLSTIVCSLLILFLLEVGVRFFFPRINHQDTQLSLFQNSTIGDSVGWKPNAKGTSFGEIILIDSDGFRKMNSPRQFHESWLILGDSVTFGVGVKTEETFVQLLQDKLPSKKLWNTAVVGYSLFNYKEVFDYFLKEREDIEKILLFFCINDIYKNLKLKPSYQTINEKLLSFLRRHSKFYMLLKNMFFDRSKTYALHDIGLYYEGSEQLQQAVDIIHEMDKESRQRGIGFLVVILPYEYQLRSKGEHLRPQKILYRLLSERQVSVIDAYDFFASEEQDSKKYYLYADPMHFSNHGHRVIFELTAEVLLH